MPTLVNKILRVKRNLVTTLRGISKDAGAAYDVTVSQVDETDDPRADVGVTLLYEGSDGPPDDREAIGSSDRFLTFSIHVACARKLANEDTPIDEVCLAVGSDIWEAIMEDNTQGREVRITYLGPDERVPIKQGYYAHVWEYRFWVRLDEDAPNSD